MLSCLICGDNCGPPMVVSLSAIPESLGYHRWPVSLQIQLLQTYKHCSSQHSLGQQFGNQGKRTGNYRPIYSPEFSYTLVSNTIIQQEAWRLPSISCFSSSPTIYPRLPQPITKASWLYLQYIIDIYVTYSHVFIFLPPLLCSKSPPPCLIAPF